MNPINILITNAGNILKFLKEFTVDSAKDVSITYVNADGSESVKTFSNIAKQIVSLDSWKSNFLTSNEAKQLRNFPQQITYGTDAPFGDFTNWSTAGATIEEIGTISSGTAWADRSDFDKEWLTAMGLSGIQNFAPSSFKVYRLTASADRSGHSFPYFQYPVNDNSYTTYGAFVKHIQGEVPYGWWCQGLQETNGIKLCGGHIQGSSSHYSYCHPYKAVGAVDTIIEVALAGVVDTYVPLDNPHRWWNVNSITRL